MSTSDWSQLKLYNNTAGKKKRFELGVENHIAFLEYIQTVNGVVYLTHTEVPPSLEGKGIGKALVSKTISYLINGELLLAPLCPFVAAYLKRHPEIAKDILAPGFSIG
ncbi:GNAT family N-acetyltransferase [Eudoraea sp.]|uniref:GNAT family N-acetyltransferase n=1 Tax=Eudoraea sp. TaxID=1979955 RepID=UPI003C754523